MILKATGNSGEESVLLEQPGAEGGFPESLYRLPVNSIVLINTLSRDRPPPPTDSFTLLVSNRWSRRRGEMAAARGGWWGVGDHICRAEPGRAGCGRWPGPPLFNSAGKHQHPARLSAPGGPGPAQNRNRRGFVETGNRQCGIQAAGSRQAERAASSPGPHPPQLTWAPR